MRSTIPKNHYSEFASFYDAKWRAEHARHVNPSSEHLSRANVIRSAIAGHSRLGATNCSLRILDHGCGMGWLTPFVEEFGTVTGVDLSPAGVARASATFPDHHFETIDGFQKRMDVREAYDVVVSQEVIEHVENQDEYLVECHSYLKPGGILILTTPNKWAVINMRKTLQMPLDKLGEQPVENILTISELRALVGRHFRIRRVFTVVDAIAHCGLHRLLNSVKLRRLIPGWKHLPYLLNAGLHTVVIAQRSEES